MSAKKKQPKKPELRLTGKDGNAYAILAAGRRVAQANGMEWQPILQEAQSGDYDHLIQTMMKHFEVV